MSNLTLLILGLLITNIMHLVTAFSSTRQTLINKFGKTIYITLYATLSTLGLGLIIMGYMEREFTIIFDNQVWHSHLNKLVMLFALILLIAQFFNGHIKAKLKQPAILAVLVWAIGHLIANGDLYSVVLFSGFAIYAIIALMIKRIVKTADKKACWLKDVYAIIIGTIIYLALFMSHAHFTGMPLF